MEADSSRWLRNLNAWPASVALFLTPEFMVPTMALHMTCCASCPAACTCSCSGSTGSSRTRRWGTRGLQWTAQRGDKWLEHAGAARPRAPHSFTRQPFCRLAADRSSGGAGAAAAAGGRAPRRRHPFGHHPQLLPQRAQSASREVRAFALKTVVAALLCHALRWSVAFIARSRVWSALVQLPSSS